MKHGTVKIGDWTIPLIGVPENATLEMCDLCGYEYDLIEIVFTGKEFICPLCAGAS